MRKLLYIFILLQITTITFAQDDLSKLTAPIVEEGKKLYKSEMASWYGTDLFIAKYKYRDNIGGYFSYSIDTDNICIFFSKTENPKVIGTITFDSTYNIETAGLNLNEREFTQNEKDLYEMRKVALKAMTSDTLFKVYKNTDLNLIPIITDTERKVYVLTGPKQSGVVIFGNDYLLTFDNTNTVIDMKQLHKNIIPINSDNKDAETTMHSHLPETGDFITATDICTLLLYEKFTSWQQHNVVSQKYLSIWNCKTDELTVLSMDAVKKIAEDQEKRNKKK